MRCWLVIVAVAGVSLVRADDRPSTGPAADYNNPRAFAQGLPTTMVLGFYKAQDGRELRNAITQALKYIPEVTTSEFPANHGQPKFLGGDPPVFPYQYKHSDAGGYAYAFMLVSEEGKVARVLITDASKPAFAVNAANAVVTWRFKPVSLNHVHVPFLLMVRVDFAMTGV
ncbi:MAG TPA: energy transducer TonB [Candidatus Didemnitutus sp.]|nr:energy transducer TonB [Candidatus Didemnitutus sp.]